jgi:hypothetical protein
MASFELRGGGTFEWLFYNELNFNYLAMGEEGSKSIWLSREPTNLSNIRLFVQLRTHREGTVRIGSSDRLYSLRIGRRCREGWY